MRRLITILGATLLLAGGCQSTTRTVTADHAPVGVARPLEGWDGVNNAFRDGQFYFAGQPEEAAIRRYADEGVVTVVNVRTPPEIESLPFDEAEVVESLGMRYVSIPVSPETLSVDDVERFTEVLSESEGPVLIHCGSSNRVGGIWAAYLVRERGMDVEDAIERGKAAGLRSDSMVEAARRVAGE